MLSSHLTHFSSILALAIFFSSFITAVHAVPYNAIAPYPRPYWQATAGLFYHRCSSPTQVEFSKDQVEWRPSAICQRGTCCSNLSDSPSCTKAACELVEKEIRTSEEWKEKSKNRITFPLTHP